MPCRESALPAGCKPPRMSMNASLLEGGLPQQGWIGSDVILEVGPQTNEFREQLLQRNRCAASRQKDGVDAYSDGPAVIDT